MLWLCSDLDKGSHYCVSWILAQPICHWSIARVV